jgi:hypothetical protein
MVAHAYHSTQEAEAGDFKFRSSLGYTVRLSQKKFFSLKLPK